MNGICYEEFSQSLRVIYFMAVQIFFLLSKTLQEIASSLYLFLVFNLVTLWCHPGHEIMLASYLGAWVESNANLVRKYYETKALFKKGLNFFRG